MIVRGPQPKSQRNHAPETSPEHLPPSLQETIDPSTGIDLVLQQEHGCDTPIVSHLRTLDRLCSNGAPQAFTKLSRERE